MRGTEECARTAAPAPPPFPPPLPRSFLPAALAFALVLVAMLEARVEAALTLTLTLEEDTYVDAVIRGDTRFCSESFCCSCFCGEANAFVVRDVLFLVCGDAEATDEAPSENTARISCGLD